MPRYEGGRDIPGMRPALVLPQRKHQCPAMKGVETEHLVARRVARDDVSTNAPL